jgi:hypothetical protein
MRRTFSSELRHQNKSEVMCMCPINSAVVRAFRPEPRARSARAPPLTGGCALAPSKARPDLRREPMVRKATLASIRIPSCARHDLRSPALATASTHRLSCLIELGAASLATRRGWSASGDDSTLIEKVA